MPEYIELYDVFVRAKDSSIKFVNGPQFDANDWVVFKTGTEECLSVIQSHNGVPLSYLLRDDITILLLGLILRCSSVPKMVAEHG